MKHALIITGLLVFTLHGFTQRMLLPTWTVNDSLSSIGLYGYGSFSSDAITNRFIGQLVSDGNLEQSARMDQYTKLNPDRNKVGGSYAVGVQGRIAPFKDRSWSLLFSLTDEAFGEAVYSPEAFGLIFFGNEPFRGDTLRAGSNYVRFARFQKMGFGLSKRSESGVEYGLMLSFVNGESVAHANIPTASIYTSAIGDTVSAQLNGNVFVSDTGNVGFMRHNGAGAMLDFYLSQRFEFLDRTWKAKASIMNLGMVQWRPSTQHYRIDSTVQWTGIKVDDITQIEQQVNAFSVEDSIDGLVNGDRWRGPVNQILPGWMQLQIDQIALKGFTAGLGVTFRPESFAFPYGYVLPGYQFSEHFGMEMEFGYGGYAGFQAGCAARYINKAWAIRLRAANLEGVVAPGSFGGLTLAGSVQYFFEL